MGMANAQRTFTRQPGDMWVADDDRGILISLNSTGTMFTVCINHGEIEVGDVPVRSYESPGDALGRAFALAREL